MYYLFEVKKWKALPEKITVKEDWPHQSRKYTNLFLLKHSKEIPELWLQSEEEYRLYNELKRVVKETEIEDIGEDIGLQFKNMQIKFENGMICAYKNSKLISKYDIQQFRRSPNSIFRKIYSIVN